LPFCPSCGNEVNTTNKFCSRCGLNLAEALPNGENVTTKPALKPNSIANSTNIGGPAEYPWRTAVYLQEDEAVDRYESDVKEFYEDPKVAIGARVGKKGFLVLTNQRILFACKLGLLAKDYAVAYTSNLEDVTSVAPGKFGFNQKLVIFSKGGDHRDFIKPGLHFFGSFMNDAITKRKKELRDQASGQAVVKEKEVRVVVKIPCRFCGTLNDQLSTKCVSCGATVR